MGPLQKRTLTLWTIAGAVSGLAGMGLEPTVHSVERAADTQPRPKTQPNKPSQKSSAPTFEG
jgi:hypothetical protein